MARFGIETRGRYPQTNQVSLASGTRIGIYEIVGPIGAGGMGEVYRARDSRLNRDVALKVLPETFAADTSRVARFRREAQLLATLNHANIAQIYGWEEIGSQSNQSAPAAAIVLELVDGRTLADRLTDGPVPLDETVVIARQIADALESAHECGIIHRDLKPANVKVKEDGTVKVLDFGLGKVFDPTATVSADVLNSPTISAQATQAGVVLGTAAYMAPEQAKGRVVDRRADIWAFGVVVYEMLSGRRLFEGEDVSETLAAVLRQPIPWSTLPEGTPATLRHLLARCLERDPRKRLRDIGEARIALENPTLPLAGGAGFSESPAAPVGATRALWKRAAALAVVALIAASIGALAIRSFQTTPAAPVVRFDHALADGLTFAPLARPFLNVSADGTQIAYVYGANRRLYVRRISELAAQPVQGTENLGELFAPAFSPDGRALAFWADGTIKRVPVEGGPVVSLCPADNPYGLSWHESGIVFAQGEKGIIARISPNGGTPEVIARSKPGELVSGSEILPGGRFVVFSVTTGTATEWDRGRIIVRSLDSGEDRTLVEGASDARYLRTGHLVYAKQGVLFAAPFDAARAQVEGPEVPVLSGVRRGNPGLGTAHYALSPNGTLVYVPGPAAAAATVDFGLFDRTGKGTPLKLPLGAYSHPRVSPDGHQLAFTVSAGDQEFIAVYELSGTKAMRRLTMAGRSRFPVWAANGTRVAYQTDRDGDVSIFWQAADGSGSPERLTKAGPGEAHAPESWSPTTSTLLFSVIKDGRHTLWSLSLPDKSTTTFGAVTSTVPINAVFSPNGRWIAYQSDQAGRTTVYVQSVPATGAGYQYLPRRTDVPHEPMWSPDGQELFLNPRAGDFEVVPVTTEPKVDFGNPVDIPRPFRLTPPQGRRSYDIAPDGRIVAVIVPEIRNESAAAPVLALVLNWHEELKAKVPVPRR